MLHTRHAITDCGSVAAITCCDAAGCTLAYTSCCACIPAALQPPCAHGCIAGVPRLAEGVSAWSCFIHPGMHGEFQYVTIKAGRMYGIMVLF
jgi:hypothetical protein